MKTLSYYFIMGLFLFISVPALHAQEIVGKWKTIDDETNKPKSIVEIYKEGGKYFGKVVKLFRGPDEEQDPVCEECTDHRKGQKVLGMIVIEDMEKDGSEFSGGEILDPENGKTYRCKIWLEEGKLKVRGYIAFLYRTQTWLPVKG